MEGLRNIAGQYECVQLSELAPLTTLFVWTHNSLYRVVVIDGAHVYVQGGDFFADPSPAEIVGARMGSGFLFDGLICIGLEIELRAGGTRFRTSRVVAMTTESAHDAIVH